MGFLVPLALLGWIPVVMGLFAMMPARRAVITAYMVAWLFLPMAAYELPGLPDYTKMSATCVGILVAAAIFDSKRLFAFTPRWFDIPMLVCCLCPAAASITNGLGVPDGISAAMYQTIAWGLPYLIGRVYFSDIEGIQELAIGLFIGGLVYVPLCLFEIRMSPKLHYMVYGFYQVGLSQGFRFGGWRPMVFLQHGLMVGMWMSMTGLLGLWLWWTGSIRRIAGMPAALAALALLVTAVLCKSTGALVLMATGMGVLVVLRLFKLRVVVVALVLAAPLYAGMRASGLWTGDLLLNISGSFDQERAESLQVRIDNEQKLAAHALEQPIFGWGGWGRSRLKDERGRDTSITDGYWIIVLGTTGLVGLTSFFAVFLLPTVYVMYRVPPTAWGSPPMASLAGLAVVMALFMIDCIPNAMLNPVFAVVAGGVTGCLTPGALSLRPVAAEPESDDGLVYLMS